MLKSKYSIVALLLLCIVVPLFAEDPPELNLVRAAARGKLKGKPWREVSYLPPTDCPKTKEARIKKYEFFGTLSKDGRSSDASTRLLERIKAEKEYLLCRYTILCDDTNGNECHLAFVLNLYRDREGEENYSCLFHGDEKRLGNLRELNNPAFNVCVIAADETAAIESSIKPIDLKLNVMK